MTCNIVEVEGVQCVDLMHLYILQMSANECKWLIPMSGHIITSSFLW